MGRCGRGPRLCPLAPPCHRWYGAKEFLVVPGVKEQRIFFSLLFQNEMLYDRVKFQLLHVCWTLDYACDGCGVYKLVSSHRSVW